MPDTLDPQPGNPTSVDANSGIDAGTVLAFDYGLKNIGVAVGEIRFASASELKPFKARDGVPNWPDIEALLREWQPKIVLVGKPLNMDGSDSELSQRAQKFANRLHGRFGVQIAMVDERLTTREAKAQARQRNHRGDYGNNPVDSIAARIILESWYQFQRDQQTQ